MLWGWQDLIWFNRFPHGYHDSLEEDPEDVMDVWEENGKIFHSAFVFLFIYLFSYSVYLFKYLFKEMNVTIGVVMISLLAM